MTMPHLMNCGHSDTGWCLDCVKAQWEELDKLKTRISELEDTLDLNNDEFARIWTMSINASEVRQLCDRARQRTKQTVPMIEQLERAHAEADALKRLRDELIELNDRLKVEKNREAFRAESAEENHRMEKQRLESCKTARELIRQQNVDWHRRCEQLNRDIDELRERAEVADERLDKKCVECGDLQTAINNALELVNKDCPSMDRFVNIVPTVQWLLQKWRECRQRWQETVASVAPAPEANFPISKCQCSDSPGWTAIRCCNLCGLMHNSETLDWRTGPLERVAKRTEAEVIEAMRKNLSILDRVKKDRDDNHRAYCVARDALAEAIEALEWYAHPKQAEVSLSDNGEHASEALARIAEKLK